MELTTSKPLYIAAYYRPHESDSHSLDEFRKSLERVNAKKGNIWVLGDLNYPKLAWNSDTLQV